MLMEPHLAARPANHPPLTPVEFLFRSVEVHRDRPNHGGVTDARQDRQQ